MTLVDSQQTLEPPRPEGASRTPARLCLTVVWHPQADFVGRRHLAAAGQRVALSRLEPLFAHPGETSAVPLGDAHLSRAPVWLTQTAGDRLLVAPDAVSREVHVGGELVTGPLELEAGALARGVLVELSRRVLVLVHRLTPSDAAAPRRGLMGESEAMARLRREIAALATGVGPVLVQGETGTGKELVAEALCAAGPRRDRPFLRVNVAAIPAATAASQLFGHRRGAFTGAERDHRGYFEQAHGGTLLLDEIGATPVDVQPMLLRALESGEVQPLGEARPLCVDVAVIAASDRDLAADAASGRFSPALLHRLSGATLVVPPLRERRDDVTRLLVHFWRQASSGSSSEAVPSLAAGLVAQLVEYDWPGNVRELKNAARRLALAATPGGVSLEDFPPLVSRAAPATTIAQSRTPPSLVSEAELVAALDANAWDMRATARALGIARSSLYVRLRACPSVHRVQELGDEDLARAAERCDGDLDRMAAELKVSRAALGRRWARLHRRG